MFNRSVCTAGRDFADGSFCGVVLSSGTLNLTVERRPDTSIAIELVRKLHHNVNVIATRICTNIRATAATDPVSGHDDDDIYFEG